MFLGFGVVVRYVFGTADKTKKCKKIKMFSSGSLVTILTVTVRALILHILQKK